MSGLKAGLHPQKGRFNGPSTDTRIISVEIQNPGCCNRTMISTSTAAEVARGVFRLLMQEGYSPILEFTLPNGRRLDVAALGPGGEMLGVEIKVALADLRGDGKWPDYLDYCDLFYFAIPPDFPPEHVPAETGLIIADRYGGAIVKPAQTQSLHASRRKAVTISFAKVAAERLAAVMESVAQAAVPNLVMPDAADQN
jgi:hypothetical protein